MLSTVGYKILLDLVASTRARSTVAEVGYTFGTRQHGQSKLDEMVALEYVELLLDKTVGRFVPVKLVQFGAIGMLGVGVHLALLYAGADLVGAAFATAQAAAVIGAMTFNFALNNKFTYRDRQLKGWAWSAASSPSTWSARWARWPMSASAAWSMSNSTAGGSRASPARSSDRCGTMSPAAG